MRIATLILIGLATSASLLLGCARSVSCPAITAAPSPEELPYLPPRECVISASVAVEGRRVEPRPGLVPDFKEPELTPEEKEALCIKPDIINWLEFYVPKPLVPISPDLGGPAVATWGLAGDVSAIGFARRPMTVGLPSGPIAGEALTAVRVAEHGPRKSLIAEVGLDTGGVSVGEDRARKVAEHSTLCDP